MTTYLSIKWTTSRARDSYGYDIATLTDERTEKKYKTSGGGYDMQGTVFADWLQDTHQAKLLTIKDRAYSVYDNGFQPSQDPQNSFYGMTYRVDKNAVYLDGACGLDCVIDIAKAIGLTVTKTLNSKGHITGFIIEGE